MNEQQIAHLAQHMARSASRRMGGHFSREEIEDASQDAAIAILQAQARPCYNGGTGYLARAAFIAARASFITVYVARAEMRALAGLSSAQWEQLQRSFHDGKPWERAIEDDERDQIAQWLSTQRREGYRPDMGARVMQLLSRGLTQKEIGEEMGKSRWHIGMIRQRVRRTLEAAAAQH